MNIEQIMVLWDPARNGGQGRIKVVEHPDEFGKYHNDSSFLRSTGACDVRWRQIDNKARVFALFKLFHQIVVRDGLDPQVVNKAFWEVDEFAEAAVGSMFPHDFNEVHRRLISGRHEEQAE